MLEQQLNLLIIDGVLAPILQFGRQHGFLNNYFRQIVWAKILELENPKKWFDANEKCSQNDQILKDVHRSMNSLDVCKKSFDVQEGRDMLFDILDSLFIECPQYNYYQGYHDIVTIFLMVFDMDRAFDASKKAAAFFFKDYLQQDFNITVLPQLGVVHAILKEYSKETQDVKFHEVLEAVPLLTFPIPWILTWFSHSIESVHQVLRIWDYLLCSPQSTILYLCSAFIIYHQNIMQSHYEDMGEMIGTLHFYFQNLNDKHNDIQTIFTLTNTLLKKYPLEEIIMQKSIDIPKEQLLHDSVFWKQFKTHRQLNPKTIQQQPKLLYEKYILHAIGITVSIFLNQYLIK